MSRKLTASDRKSLIRLASTMPKGSPERRAILASLKVAGEELEGNTAPIRDLQRAWPRLSWKGTPIKKLADAWQAKFVREDRWIRYSSIDWVAAALHPQWGLRLVYEVEGSLQMDNRVHTVGPGNQAVLTGEGDIEVASVRSFRSVGQYPNGRFDFSEFSPKAGYRSLGDVLQKLKKEGYQILWPR